MSRPLRRCVVASSVAILTTLAACSPTATGQAVVRQALLALGADSLTSIQYSGTGVEFGVGQSERADGPWSKIGDVKVTRAIDFTRPWAHTTVESLTGPRTYHVIVGEPSPWTGQLDIWTTPWGFLWGALAHEPTVERRTIDGRDYDVVSWMSSRQAPGRVPYRLNGYINREGLLERVETWAEHRLFGDMLVETRFADYKDFSGVKVPSSIIQTRAGWPQFTTTISSATPNPPNIAELLRAPDPRPGARPRSQPQPRPPVKSEQLADGIYRIPGDYVSLAVAFADHVVIIEGPENDERTTAVIAEVKRVMPDKPIQYVVNTHHHEDHAGGLAGFAAEGATIVTHERNKTFLDRAINGPRTLNPDRLTQSKRKAQFETVGDVRILKDGARTLELHHIQGLAHADGMLIAYLPAEKIVVQADMAFIGPDPPGAGERRAATLVANLERLKLSYDSVVFIHPPQPDRKVTKADLLKIAAAEK